MSTAPVIVTTTSTELAERTDLAYERFVALLADTAETLAVDGTWRAVDVAGHLVNVVNRYVDFAPDRLAAHPRGVDAINDQELDVRSGRPMTEVIADLATEMARFRSSWGPQAVLPLDVDIPFHGGGTIDVQAGLTNLLGEYLVHGLDVARAKGDEWPIDDRDGALLVAFGAQILSAYVRTTNTERLHVRLDLDGVDPWVLDVDGADATSRIPEPDDDPDVCLRGPATPVALLFYGRLDLDGALAHGLEVCGGTRPERAALLTELFEEP